jgi:hypothetical protein
VTGGLAATVLTGLVLWPIGSRLCLAAASRAAAVTLFALGALGVELLTPTGSDGRAAALLAMSACLMVAGPVRTLVAALGVVLAAVLCPPVGIAVLVLLAAMAFSGGLVRRWSPARRYLAGGGALLVAAAGLVWVARTGRDTLPYVLLGALTLWTVAIVVPLWWRAAWLRPVCAGAVVLVATCWLGGGSAPAVVTLTVLAVLTMMLLSEVRPWLRTSALVTGVPIAVAGLALLVATPAEAVRAAAPALLVTPSLTHSGVRPVRIEVPAIGVASPLEELTADPATGELAAPHDPARAGWFAAGVVPGDPGPAVVGGHVDSRAGPGVFFRLARLRPGDTITITRSDAHVVTFVVTDVRSAPKTAFPTAAVYGPVPGAELRLVTCGGEFDRALHGYPDNVIVDAVSR